MVYHVIVLGQQLFNINIYDLFFINTCSDITNYVDDTTTYECHQYCDEVICNLELTIPKTFDWLKYTNFKANAIKCPLSYLPLYLPL